mmetsp:Transcript_22278/g.63945  ORF Transcript_22278/g.63945 Transcript_22278/m.63945 type:complete len:134 (-) Transcript_22278:747-1148(-)
MAPPPVPPHCLREARARRPQPARKAFWVAGPRDPATTAALRLRPQTRDALLADPLFLAPLAAAPDGRRLPERTPAARHGQRRQPFPRRLQPYGRVASECCKNRSTGSRTKANEIRALAHAGRSPPRLTSWWRV